MSLPSGFPYYVATECLLAPEPLNLSDHHLSSAGAIIVPPSTQATGAAFQILRTRTARISHQFFSAFRSMDRLDPERYELAFATDARFEHVLDDMPYFSRDWSAAVQAGAETFPWMAIARCHVHSLIAHRRLLLFRDHFTMA